MQSPVAFPVNQAGVNVGRGLGFYARSARVDNPNNCWLQFPDAGVYVPPFTIGMTFNFPSATQAPRIIPGAGPLGAAPSGPAPRAGSYSQATFDDQEQGTSSGSIGFAAPDGPFLVGGASTVVGVSGLSVTPPAGGGGGDWLLLVVGAFNAANATPSTPVVPAGWTLLTNSASTDTAATSGAGVAIFARPYDPSAVVVTVANSTVVQLACFLVRNTNGPVVPGNIGALVVPGATIATTRGVDQAPLGSLYVVAVEGSNGNPGIVTAVPPMTPVVVALGQIPALDVLAITTDSVGAPLEVLTRSIAWGIMAVCAGAAMTPATVG